MDEKTLKRRQEDLVSQIASRPGARDADPDHYTGQVYDGGHMVSAAGRYFLTHPVTISGQECEGCEATASVNTDVTRKVFIVGGRIPVAGDIVTARLLRSGRWLAERSGGKLCIRVVGCGGLPLDGADITVTQDDIEIFTGVSSCAHGSCIDASGQLTIKATKDRFKDKTVTINVSGNGTTTVNVQMDVEDGYYCPLTLPGTSSDRAALADPLPAALTATTNIGTYTLSFVSFGIMTIWGPVGAWASPVFTFATTGYPVSVVAGVLTCGPSGAIAMPMKLSLTPVNSTGFLFAVDISVVCCSQIGPGGLADSGPNTGTDYAIPTDPCASIPFAETVDIQNTTVVQACPFGTLIDLNSPVTSAVISE